MIAPDGVVVASRARPRGEFRSPRRRITGAYADLVTDPALEDKPISITTGRAARNRRDRPHRIAQGVGAKPVDFHVVSVARRQRLRVDQPGPATSSYSRAGACLVATVLVASGSRAQARAGPLREVAEVTRHLEQGRLDVRSWLRPPTSSAPAREFDSLIETARRRDHRDQPGHRLGLLGQHRLAPAPERCWRRPAGRHPAGDILAPRWRWIAR